MSANESVKYVENAADLLDKLRKDSKVKVVSKPLPWDKDFEIVDYYLDCAT